MAETRKLAAILAADVVGYSRLAGADEERTLARLRALRSDLIDPTIAVHHGRVVKRTSAKCVNPAYYPLTQLVPRRLAGETESDRLHCRRTPSLPSYCSTRFALAYSRA